MSPRRLSLIAAAATLLAAAAAPAPAEAQDRQRLEQKVREAAELVPELARHAPAWALERADCASVLVVGRGGFLIGGTGGYGFLSCKENGAWSAPAVLDVGGTSAGAQVGGQRSEVLMLFVGVEDRAGVARSAPVFQGTAQATAGPEGVGVSGGGNPSAESSVVTVYRNEGLYAGAAGEILAVEPDGRLNERFYGREVSARELLVDRTVPAPEAAFPFLQALSRCVKSGGCP